MAEKKLIRVFPMRCCKLWKTFTFDDFSYTGRMTLICHKHPDHIVEYITWKSGINKEDFDRVIEEHKKKKLLPPLA